jgi:aminocarboxymuconate-semialdehyde decarboxylase
MIIDVHNHAIPESVLSLLRNDSSFGVTVSDGVMRSRSGFEFPLTSSFFDPRAKLEELSVRGIEGAVVSIAPPAFLYEVDDCKSEELCEAANEGLAHYARVEPDHFRWMAHIPMGDLGRAIPMLERAKNAGAVGVEIATQIRGVRPDHSSFEPFWRSVNDLKLPVMLHPFDNAHYPGIETLYLQNVIGNPLETMISGCRLICSGVFDRLQNLRVMLVHAGGYLPYQLGRLQHAATVRTELAGVANPWDYLDRFFFDTLTFDTQALAYLVGRVGVQNVVIGTDLPFDMSPKTPVQDLRAAVASGDSERISAANPANLFGWQNT